MSKVEEAESLSQKQGRSGPLSAWQEVRKGHDLGSPSQCQDFRILVTLQ